MVCKICTHARSNFHLSLQLHYVLEYVITVGNWDINSVIAYWVMTHMQYLGYCDLVARLSRFLGWPQPLVIELHANIALIAFSFSRTLTLMVCINFHSQPCDIFVRDISVCDALSPILTFGRSVATSWLVSTSTRSITCRCAVYGNCRTHDTRDCNISLDHSHLDLL